MPLTAQNYFSTIGASTNTSNTSWWARSPWGYGYYTVPVGLKPTPVKRPPVEKELTTGMSDAEFDEKLQDLLFGTPRDAE